MRRGFPALVLVLFLSGCGPAPRLPEITMTAGGGFVPITDTWHIAPDGSWTWTRTGELTAARSGKLTARQRDELAARAGDQELAAEMLMAPRRCAVSDGSDERLAIGDVRYRAGWCPEHRPRIDRLRARILALTG